MPSRQELELRELLRQVRQQNTAAQRPVESSLPDLTPELLMSPAAIREMQAAMPPSQPLVFPLPQDPSSLWQGSVDNWQPPLPDRASFIDASVTPADLREAVEEVSDLRRDFGALDRRIPQDAVVVFDDAVDWGIDLDSEPEPAVPAEDLECIFMQRAMAEMGAGRESPSYLDDFRLGEEVGLVPLRSVDQRPEPPPGRYRPPADSHVVSRRVGDRWPSGPPVPREARTAPVPSRAPTPSKPVAPSPTRTVYEHLLGDSPLDDY